MYLFLQHNLVPQAGTVGNRTLAVQAEEYARFTRIVFDTAPTGHTLRLLALPEFAEQSLEKIIRVRRKLMAAPSAVRPSLASHFLLDRGSGTALVTPERTCLSPL